MVYLFLLQNLYLIILNAGRGMMLPIAKMRMNGGFIMVKETLKAGQKPTKSQIREIKAAEKRAIIYHK